MKISLIDTFFPQFIKEAKRKKIAFHHIFDHEVRKNSHPILRHVGKNYRFFPKGYSAPASIDFFGDRLYLCSTLYLGGVSKDAVFTVMINESIANSFRLWFEFMWQSAEKA
ncbi:MAG: hypothetical protein KDD60_04990 [Bdellovibrionales bacterium]|nr:hypothetical protein [Bdellovibrionales bacterium]